MYFNLVKVLADYAQAQPKRASGGLYALAGFDYQLRLYVAKLAEALAAGGNDLEEVGRVFMEALSDLTKHENDNLVCIQAKRTLTRATLKDAAVEFAAIENFLAQRYPNERTQFKFELIASQGDASLSWSDLPVTAPEHAIADSLVSQGRLAQPRLEPDPGWRSIIAVWKHLDAPYDFVRFALDRALSRAVSPEDARRVRDDICERYTQGRSSALAVGQLLRPEDFDSPANLSPHLEIGREITLARVRDRQYMPRESRRDALFATLEERYELSRHDLQSAARVFWLSGRSGVGKSVLLLQVVERLVREGRRVLWLGGSAEKLEPALRALAGQPEDLRPEFVAIDDLYDRDARSRLDLTSLGAFIDEAGPHPWPLILSCGPAEFADAFEEESRYRGFELHRETIFPVAADESLRLADWYRQRTGREPAMKPASAPAFTQAREDDDGLFISLAVELEHGELKEFARRFAARIVMNGLEKALLLPLALNRLYLRTPYDWLEENDREKLATLNREGDFNLLDPGEAGQVVRLTHPHLGDALYRALRKPGNPTAYAHDLRDAFCRALQEGHSGLVVQLLRLFSAKREGLTGERLALVDDVLLANACSQAWRDMVSGLALDDEVAADAATSWACWAVDQPGIAKILGDGLLAKAMDCLNDAVKVWPACWERLWQRYPANSILLDWAATHLPESQRMGHPAWSFVWEKAQHADAEQARWQHMGMAWLESHTRRPDWHFIWKRLLPQPPISNWADFPVLSLGEKRLDAGGDGSDWAYVLEDLLQRAGNFPQMAEKLLAQGCAWLKGREDRAEWNYVWSALLAQPEQLPEDISLTDLLAQGCAWLQGREDRAEWTHVWQALLAQPEQLPEDISLTGLLAQGYTWLQEREDRAEWTHVWQALLTQSKQLPEDSGLTGLLAQGYTWLKGREDRAEWNYVWSALRVQPEQLPEDISTADLFAQGYAWLQGREDRAGWNRVWQALLAQSKQLPEDISPADLFAQGCAWLKGREDRAEWAHVWEALLARTEQLPEDIRLTDLFAQGCTWLKGREDRAEWTHVWQTLLAQPEQLPEDISLTDLHAQGWHWLKGREDRADWSYIWEDLRRQPISESCQWDPYQLDEMAWRWLSGHRDAKDWPVIWSGVAHDSKLSEEKLQALMEIGIDWLATAGHLDAPETSRFVEGLLDLGCCDARFLPLAASWLQGAKQKWYWPISAAKFIAASPFSPAAAEMAAALTLLIQACPNSTVITKSALILERLACLGDAVPSAISTLLTAFAERASAPAWERAQELKRSGTPTQGKVVAVKPDFCAVELDVGLMGRLPRYAGQAIIVGDVVSAVIQRVKPETGFVGLRHAIMTTGGSADSIAAGEVCEGIVNGSADYGLFVNIRDHQGLIHISKLPGLASFYASHPKGSRIMVRVLSVTPKRLQLELADTTEPTESKIGAAATEIVVGGEYEGEVVGLMDYGLFVRIGNQSGLLHRSQLPNPIGFRDRHPIGSTIRVRVLAITPKGPSLGIAVSPNRANEP